MRPRRLFHQRRIAHRRGTDNHARNALAEPGVERGAIANAAAELDRDIHRGKDAVHRGGIDRFAGEGAVKIDNVQIVKALPLERRGLRRRIAIEHGRPRHVALLQAHRFAVFQIDGGKQNHGFHFRKFAISASPNFWLFSGWNCVPTILSRPTIAVIGPP